ncbi:OBAP family protein [Stenotrophomonas acidaminiphila]|uniref:OBAP family protein n=1 Tax=Stenotrophomonas acidaminiphila TaxID=128780 RepID=UPI003BF4BD98
MAKTSRWTAACMVACLVGGCGGGKTESGVEPPGADESAKTQVLDAGAAVLQDKPPIDALNAYLDGFHFYNGDIAAQMEAHHYCSVLNDDVIQCVIFDGSVREAKIMGVEYIVSAELFAGLPDDEKTLWHSHVHEVKSGTLVAPGLPEAAEHALMENLVGTYGKTWHTWHTDQDLELPLGVPQLMMGFTQDGQADLAMIAQRDERLGIDSSDKRAKRADIPAPPNVPGADSWQQGKVIQIVDPTGQVHDHAQPQDQTKNENATSK